jgi:hypothetical protein
MFLRRQRLLVSPLTKPDSRLVHQFRNNLRHPKRKRQEYNMRRQETWLKTQGSSFTHRKTVDQERGIDFMKFSVPASSDVESVAEGPEDGAVDEIEREGDPA